MPLALLLSPDDQAVSAITAVLEEMSVTCERPLDGVTAAQKLNSHSFDLVLVDCENLPAAKLIFDVCRRGKGGNSAVPIAIVDGRAGLPTAFRLGAELILTKPVAKDQARNTIRNAVGRVKKEEPARTADPINTIQTDAVQADALQVIAGEKNQEFSVEPADQKMAEERALAATAAASSPQMTSFPDPVSMATLSAPALTPTALTPTLSAPVAMPEISAAPAAEVGSVLVESKPSVQHKPSDDPVLAELEKAEAESEEKAEGKPEAKAEAKAEAKPEPEPEAKPQPIFSSYQESQSKRGEGKQGESKKNQSKQEQSKRDQRTRSPLVAVLALLLVCAGFYAAWMYEPGFRALAQPQLDRVLALAGVARQPQPTAPTAVKPVAQPTKVLVPASPADSAQSSELPATNPGAAATAPSTTSGGAAAPSPASTTPASASPVSAVSSSATRATGLASTGSGAAALPAGKSGPTKIELAKAGGSQIGVSQNAANQNTADSKGAAVARPSDTELPGEKTAIILSSKGADKRLMHSVQPTYPAGTRPTEVQGTMVLKAVVDENGNVAGARVIEGNTALAADAINAVKQWRYRPYVRDGKAQPFQTIVLVDFQRP